MIEFITWVFSIILPPQDLISPIPIEAVAQSAPSNSPTTLAQITPSPEVLAAATQLPTTVPTNAATSSAFPMSSNTPKPTQSASPKIIATPTASSSAIPQSTQTPAPTTKSITSPSPSPTTTTRPQTKQPTGPEMDAMFTKYSEQYKIDRELLRRIAICESNLNVNSLNKKYGYGGLYQFSPGSWKSYRKVMGQDTNPDLRFEPDEAIKTAAWMISTGRQTAWPNCK